MKMTYIYGLYATENNIRYVGKTDNLKKRLYEHILNSKYKKTHKDIWIQKELSNENTIKIILLEEVLDENWKAAEVKWMEYYKTNNLTNHAKGGMGGRQEVYTIPYDDAKSWIKENLSCKSKNEWFRLNAENKISSFIPKDPYHHYKNKGWVSWGDFLKTGRVQDNNIITNYMSYESAKKIIKTMSISTFNCWKKLIKEKKVPKNIPNKPDRFYKKRGWISWGDFLGTDKIANQNKKFISYENAKKWLKNNNLIFKSRKEWFNFCKSNKRPNFIPSNPDKTYKNNGWINYNCFLEY